MHVAAAELHVDTDALRLAAGQRQRGDLRVDLKNLPPGVQQRLGVVQGADARRRDGEDDAGALDLRERRREIANRLLPRSRRVAPLDEPRRRTRRADLDLDLPGLPIRHVHVDQASERRGERRHGLAERHIHRHVRRTPPFVVRTHVATCRADPRAKAFAFGAVLQRDRHGLPRDGEKSRPVPARNREVHADRPGLPLLRRRHARIDARGGMGRIDLLRVLLPVVDEDAHGQALLDLFDAQRVLGRGDDGIQRAVRDLRKRRTILHVVRRQDLSERRQQVGDLADVVPLRLRLAVQHGQRRLAAPHARLGADGGKALPLDGGDRVPVRVESGRTRQRVERALRLERRLARDLEPSPADHGAERAAAAVHELPHLRHLGQGVRLRIDDEDGRQFDRIQLVDAIQHLDGAPRRRRGVDKLAPAALEETDPLRRRIARKPAQRRKQELLVRRLREAVVRDEPLVRQRDEPPLAVGRRRRHGDGSLPYVAGGQRERRPARDENRPRYAIATPSTSERARLLFRFFMLDPICKSKGGYFRLWT